MGSERHTREEMREIKMRMDEENAMKSHNQKSVQDILKPLLLSMKLFGVYHDINDLTSVRPTNGKPSQVMPKTKLCSWVTFSRVYCITVLVLMWADLIRYAIAVPPIDEGLTARIVLVVWFVLVALGDLVMFITCENKHYLHAFYKYWNDIYQDTGCVSSECRGKGLVKAVVIGTVVGWVWVFFDIVSVLYLNFWTNEGFIETFMKPLPGSDIVYVVVMLLHILATGIYVFPIIFIVVTCHIVKSSFDRLTELVEKHISNSADGVPPKLDKIRRLHLHLCRAVSVLDRTVRLLVAVEYAINIPLACFIVYQLINVKVSLITVIVNVFWLSFGIISICAITLNCAQVHEAVSIFFCTPFPHTH